MIRSDDERCRSEPWMNRNDPVFEVNLDRTTDYPNGDRLPSIMVTTPIFNDEDRYSGRTYTMSYPYWDHDYPFPGHDDENGEDALYYGGCYYDEGMGYIESADHDKRVDCFRAAEVFYRHSAGRGNAVASMCLGYVYSYDRCEGNYWVDPMTLETAEDYRRPYPREKRALECFSEAAREGIPEACYKLGDMFKHGIGCDPDPALAYSWYIRASKLALGGDSPAILGSIALRLAGCFEEGYGCEQSFSCALQMYRHAAEALEVAVEGGETWYERALARARAGKKRCQQEILA